jgi:hypothetical protein
VPYLQPVGGNAENHDTTMFEIEKTVLKSRHTNSIFGFFPTRKNANPKKPKELFFANAKQNKC